MSRVGEPQAKVRELAVPVLRRLAAAMRSGRSVEELLARINEAAVLLPGLGGAKISTVGEEIEFSSDRLTVPLVGTEGTLGVMHLPPEGGGTFDAGQLQMAAAVADAVSAVVEQFERARGQAASLALLETALNGLPVGIVCFDESNRRLYANDRAGAYLGGAVPESWDGVWEQLAPEARREPGADFVVQNGVHLLHVVARQRNDGGPRAVVLTDIAARAAAFVDGVTVDVQRSAQSGTALTFAIVAAGPNSPEALALVESLQAHLPAGSRVGPLTAESAGVAVQGVSPTSLQALIREHCRSQKLRGLRVGVAALRSGTETAERLMARASARLQAADETPRPDVFVADRSKAVAEALAVALHRSCRVTVGAPDEEGMGLLAEQPFDGLFLELPEPGAQGLDRWVRRAIELQPAARPFFVTELPGPWDLADLALPEAPVFRKPFAVREVRETVSRVLTVGE